MTLPRWKQALTGTMLLTATLTIAACESKQDKAQRFADSGVQYMEEGDYDSANLQFNTALFNDGQNLTALRGSAKIATDRKKFTRQARMLLRILEIVPDDIEANNQYARLSLLANEVERAKEHANRVLEQDPENVEALTTLAAALVLEDKAEASMEVLQRALAADPGNAEVYNLLAARSIREGDFDKAIATLDEGIAKVDDPETLLVVKLVLADQKLTQADVIDTFNQLIKTSPNSGVYREKMAEYVLLKQKDYDTAKKLFTEALPYAEKKSEIFTRIVAIEREQNGDAAAEEKLKTFVSEYPDDLDVKFLLPVFYCQTQQFDKCVAEFQAIASDETTGEEDRVRALNGIGDVAIVQRDFEKAQEIVDQVLEIDPKDSQALITLGQIQMENKDTDKAIESFRAALEGAPDNAEGLVFLALAYEASGQVKFADAQFARALDQVGYLRPVVDQYRGFLIRNGEFDRSVEVLNRYLRANPNDTDALMQRAESAIAQGEFSQAEASARQLIAGGAGSARAESILAQSLFSQQRFSDALPVAEEILKDNPDDKGNKILRASILQRLGRADEAIAELEDKISAGDAKAVDYALLGDLLIGKREYASARRVSIEGLGKYPTAEQLFVLGYISETNMGNADGAMAILRDGINKAENNAQLRTLLSNELINSQRIDEAIDVLRSLDKDNALSPLTANNLASLLAERDGDEEEALRVARLLEGTDNAFFADTLAWAYYKSGQLQNAARYARKAGDELTDNADVQYHLGIIEKELGNEDAARKALTLAKQSHNGRAQTPMSAIDQALASF